MSLRTLGTWQPCGLSGRFSCQSQGNSLKLLKLISNALTMLEMNPPGQICKPWKAILTLVHHFLKIAVTAEMKTATVFY